MQENSESNKCLHIPAEPPVSPDIIAGPEDAPITVRGRVVWYMRDRDDVE